VGLLEHLGALKSEATKLDVHGQPVNSQFNHRRVEDRQIDELMGLCKMALSDGAVDALEVRTLLSWLETNKECADRWPANVIYDRICRSLADGVLDSEEEGEILDLLVKTVGGVGSEQKSSSLPLCDPLPEVQFEGHVFCLTGKFVIGTRAYCSRLITDRGGELADNPTRATDYLVIGDIGSSNWAHSSFGRKIEKAIELRENGSISIVSEKHMQEFL
jgi:NAD-dependent DNA ligase